jgi:hypothetical protein
MSAACYLPSYNKDCFLHSCDSLFLHYTFCVFFALSWNLYTASGHEGLEQITESISLAARLMTLVATIAIMLLIMIVRMCSHSISGIYVEVGRWQTKEYNQSEFYFKTGILMLVIHIFFLVMEFGFPPPPSQGIKNCSETWQCFELHLLPPQWTHINMALIWSCYSPLLINKEIMCDQSSGLSAPLNSWVNTYIKPSIQGENKGWANREVAWGANL